LTAISGATAAYWPFDADIALVDLAYRSGISVIADDTDADAR
jgi:hypothetical protein